MTNRAGCLVRLLVGLALTVMTVAATHGLAPAAQLALAGLGFESAMVTVVLFCLASHRRR